MRVTAVLATVATVTTALVALGGIAVTSRSVASAAQASGTLAMTPVTGTDLSAIQVRTSGGCSEDSDAYNVFVFGPGAFSAGYLITSTTEAGFSRTAPFDLFFGVTMRDAATDLGTTLVAGDYPVVAQCVDSFLGSVKATFTVTVTFTGPTAYVTTPSTTTTGGPTTTGTGTTTTTAPTTTTTTVATTTTAPSTTTTTNGPGTDIGVTIPTTPPGTGLPNTGSPVRGLLIGALLLLGAGATLVSAAGRRPDRSSGPGRDHGLGRTHGGSAR